MSITVAHAYKLPSLQGVKILTGESGFQNTIDRMSILDYEFISYKMQGEFIKNDFVLCSFLFAKDDEKLMSAAVKTLIDCGVSILGIKDIYYKELPGELLDYAMDKNFSIFLFGHEVYFEEIITDVTDALRLVEKDQLIEMKIDNLFYNELSRSLVRELALEINGSFEENLAVICCMPEEHIAKEFIYRTPHRLKQLEFFQKQNSVFKYKNGLLAILTYREKRGLSARKIYQDFISSSGMNPEEYRVGVSDFYNQLHFLDKAVRQARFACEYCHIERKKMALYDSIGLYKLTLPLRGSCWLKEFSKGIIDPILQYDEKHASDLLPTAISFVENEGNIKRTAAALFQHENTIRYRVAKLQKLLNLEHENAMFYPQLCIAVQTYLLKNFE